ncbi:hypothetical protein ACFOWE_32415 [Planomonospora corallina]|uniref:Uncharacterized protein n=1 Tax=Planomonospora corallina TaxID=1806052 RepID=A0ABV8IJ65_9ACTN
MNHPWIVYLQTWLAVRAHRARTAPTRGASAVEWVIITAVTAGVALGLAALIKTLVEQKQADIQNTLGGSGGRP